MAFEDDGGVDDLFDDTGAIASEEVTIAPIPDPVKGVIRSEAQPTRQQASSFATQPASLVRLPKALSFSARAYDRSTFDETADAEELAARGRTPEDIAAIPSDALMRWRFQDGDGSARESNTRLVRWSDGSVTLHVGQYSYEMRPHAIKAASMLMGKRRGEAVLPEEGLTEGSTYLESVARLTHRATLRPVVAPASDRLVLEARNRHSRNKERVRQVEVRADPERETARAARRADEANRAREAERLRAAAAAEGEDDEARERRRRREADEEGITYDDEDLAALRAGATEARFAGDSDDDDEGGRGLFEDEDDDEDEDEDEDAGEAALVAAMEEAGEAPSAKRGRDA